MHLHALFASLVVWRGCGQVKIMSPPALAHEFAENSGIIYGATATFGAPYYGERVLGKLLYGESRNGRDHCTADDYELRESDTGGEVHIEGSEKLINVVVVRRGKCTFVQKVRIAQEKNAHAVIMVDKQSSKKTSDDLQRVVMADDGYGSTVKIPSVLISNSEGEKLLKSMETGPVIVELRWDIPRAEVVLADFWMSSGSEESLDFLERFKESAETLKYHLQFVPHYHVFSLPPGSSYGHLCVDAAVAKHCAPDPDGPGPITGQMVVHEDVRELCLYHVTAQQNPLMDPAQKGATYSEGFWEYVVRRRAECPLAGKDPSNRFGTACAGRVMAELGIDVKAVNDCITQKGEKLLDAEVENVAWSPQALRLNGWRYNGPLDRKSVLKAICSGFRKQPLECKELLHPSSLWIAAFFRGASRRHGISFQSLFWSMAFMVACLGMTFYLYKRYMTKSVRKVLREEVMLEVQSQMADYSVLADGKEGSGHGPPLSF